MASSYSAVSPTVSPGEQWGVKLGVGGAEEDSCEFSQDTNKSLFTPGEGTMDRLV